MSDILHLCREYGQPPSWWETLDRGDQALMLGDLTERMRAKRRALQSASRQRGRRGR